MAFKIKSQWNDFVQKARQQKAIIWAMAFLLPIAVYALQSPKDPAKTNAGEIETADTVIPAGYVLIPLELSNAESLSSLIGAYGVVDLFVTDLRNTQRSRKVGDNLKILRAPLNPERFAVLVREYESLPILREPGPFLAVIQNPNEKVSSQVQEISVKARSRIEQLN